MAKFDWTILEGTVAVLAHAVDQLNVTVGELAKVTRAFATGSGGGGGKSAGGGNLPAKKKEDDEGESKSLAFGINQTIGAFQGVVGVVQSFIGALDPALLEQLNWAVRNVVAALAVALRPVALVLVDVLRQLAGVILPLTQALAPVLGELAGILAEAIIPVVDAFAEIIEALMPLIPPIMAIARIITTVVVWAAKFIAVIVNALSGLYEMLGIFDLITSVFKVLEDVVKAVIRALALMIGTIAKFFGGEAFVRAMATKFQAKAGEKGTPAVASAQNFAMSSVQDLLRAQQISAAKAVGGVVGAPQKTTENFLSDIGKELEGIAKNGETFMSLVQKTLEAILQAIKELIAMMAEKIRGLLPGGNAAPGQPPGGGFFGGLFI